VNFKTVSILLALALARASFAATPVPPSITVLAAQAAKGDPKAEVALGERYQSGTGVEQSLDKAASLYTQAAEQGSRQGEFDLGNLYYLGLGVPKDTAKAAGWFEKAGLQGNPDADMALAGMYHDGAGVSQDFTKAAAWYRRAAELDDTLAQLDIAGYYVAGLGVKKDYGEALRWYSRAAAKGNAVAESSVGWMYLNGYGVKKDTAAAERWYLKAVKQDNPAAELSLGDAYLEGKLGKPDYAKALKWLTMAAGHDDADSEFLLGEMYQRGVGVSTDFATAVSWFQKSVNLGEPQAEMQLSIAYYRGFGVPIDKSKSISLIQDAASRGFAPAEMAMGDLYFAGRDVPRDTVEGQKWLDKAVAQKYPHAMCEAAFATVTGAVSDVDRAQALATLQTQAKAGDEMCTNNLSWYLATTAGVKSEDLIQSAEMMGRLVTANPKNSAYLDTMAAAEAAEGHYDAAAADEQKAIDAASAYPGADGFLKTARERLALYQSNKPYIAPPAVSTTPAPQSSTTKASADVVPAPASVALTAPIDGCYETEPAMVALTGTLLSEMTHTPIKNNSVTSNKIGRIWVLSFTPPLCIVGNQRFNDIQLVYPGGDSKLYGAMSQYKGKTLRCVGEIVGYQLLVANTSDCAPLSEAKDSGPN